MPFSLYNAPSLQQAYINNLLHEFLNDFAIVYLDNILVYSKNKANYICYVRSVLLKLCEAGLPIDIDKCEFYIKEVKYLSLIVTTKEIKIDLAKVKAVTLQEALRNVKDIQAFLSFSNFYCRFIKGFSKVAAPLTALTGKDVKFAQDNVCAAAFKELKYRFTTALLLVHYQPGQQVQVETNASNYIVAGVLSQKASDRILRPIAYYSKKITLQEYNYDIYNKELLAIVKLFEEQEPELVLETQ